MDEWKIAQRLKGEAQNASFQGNGASWYEEETMETLEKKRQEAEYRKRWNNFSSEYYFDENHKESNIEGLKKYIKYCRKTKRPIEGKRGGIGFRVDAKDSSKVYFFNRTGDRNIQIDGEEVFSECRADTTYRFVHYRRDNQQTVGVRLDREVYVLNGEEINEYISAFPHDIDDLEEIKQIEEEMVQEYLRNNPQYSKGEEGEVYRLEIDEKEEVKPLIQVEDSKDEQKSGFYEETYDEMYGEHIPEGFRYGGYKDKTREFENHCKYLYDIIFEAYKSIEEQSKRSEFTRPSTDRVERVKGLMALSKKQDREIANLQSRLNEKEGQVVNE